MAECLEENGRLVMRGPDAEYACIGTAASFYVYRSRGESLKASITFRGRQALKRQLDGYFKNKKRRKFSELIDQLVTEKP